MKKVVYKGDLPALLPTLGIEVKPGDVVEVPDDFFNPQFEDFVDKPATKKEANS